MVGLVCVDILYDVLGRVEQVSEPHFEGERPAFTRFTLDPLSRMLLIEHADGRLERSEYDGHVTRRWDPSGNLTSFIYDDQGRVASSSAASPSGAETTTLFEYGPFDVITAMIDPVGGRHQMRYDELGRRTELVTADGAVYRTRWSAFGELEEETEPDGARTRYMRDALGRTRTIESADGVTTFEWDAATNWRGLLAAAESPDGVRTEYTYDALSRPRAVTWRLADELRRFVYRYDYTGRVWRIRYPAIPGGRRVEVERFYTGSGELRAVAEVSTGETLWQVDATDARGRVLEERYGNGVVTSRTYAAAGWLATVMTRMPSTGAVLQDLEYEYEPTGAVRARHDRVRGQRDEFIHDHLGRLAQWRSYADDLIDDVEFLYDDIGRLLKRIVKAGSEPTRSYRHGDGGAPANAVTSVEDGATVRFAYDASGRRITSGELSIEYTAFNVPSMVRGRRLHTSFSYDAFHQRARKTAPRETTVYCGDLYELRRSAGATLHVHYVEAGDRIVSQLLVDERDAYPVTHGALYLHDDTLGTPETVTSGSKVVLRQHYEPFGRRVTQSRSPSVRLGFTGHEEDHALALVNMRGRIYEPGTATFLTPDPIIDEPLLGQAHNRYAYVRNDPVSRSDRTGFQAGGQPEQGSDPESSGLPTHPIPEVIVVVGYPPAATLPRGGGNDPMPRTPISPADDQGKRPPTPQPSLAGPEPNRIGPPRSRETSTVPVASADVATPPPSVLDWLERQFQFAPELTPLRQINYGLLYAYNGLRLIDLTQFLGYNGAVAVLDSLKALRGLTGVLLGAEEIQQGREIRGAVRIVGGTAKLVELAAWVEAEGAATAAGTARWVALARYASLASRVAGVTGVAIVGVTFTHEYIRYLIHDPYEGKLVGLDAVNKGRQEWSRGNFTYVPPTAFVGRRF